MRHRSFQPHGLDTAVKPLTIPADLIVSAFAILLQSNIPYQVQSADMDNGTLQVAVGPDASLRLHIAAMENLKELLADYQHFRFGSPDDEDDPEAA